jgi:predicted nucleic-acid-binding protein
MKALDTNVLARLLLKDDVLQFKKARALLASNEYFTAPVTVMLELVWVLV